MHASASVSAAPGGDHGSSRAPPPRPKLVLDSGAGIHVVGNPRLLSKLRDAPAGLGVRMANGNTLPVTKMGDIHVQGFTVPGVHLVPGVTMDLISVRELTMSGIHAWFHGDRATLFAGGEVVGDAVAPPEENGVYVLRSLSVPNSGVVDGEITSLPSLWWWWWHGSSAAASLGSVLCWLKARLFGEGPEEKPMREAPHVSNRKPRRKRKKKNSGRRRS